MYTNLRIYYKSNLTHAENGSTCTPINNDLFLTALKPNVLPIHFEH